MSGEEVGTERLRVVQECWDRLLKKGYAVQANPPPFEWRHTEKGISVFATRDLAPPTPNDEGLVHVSEVENGIIFATKGEISFGGEDTLATGEELRKKKEEDKKAKKMYRDALPLYHALREDESEAESMRFQETAIFVFTYFIRYFENTSEWIEEYAKMLPQPIGEIGKDCGGVGGVGFVYEMGEEALKKKFYGTCSEFHSVYYFARCYERIIKKHFKMADITKKVLEPKNLTLFQYILYIISQCDSRTFEGAGWIPFIDFVNGTMVPSKVNAEKENTKISFHGKFLKEGIWHILRVLKPVKKGEEIVIDYGASYADNQKILSGVILKYGTPEVTGMKPGRDSIGSVRLDIAQVYPSFLPLQKEFLQKWGGFGRKEADVGVWMSFPPPDIVNINVVEPTDPFVRQLGIATTVTDVRTLRTMVQTGRLKIPHLDITDLICTFRAFISATLAGPVYQKKTTQEFIAIWKDTSLPYVDRILARMKASEREALLVWDRSFCRALPRPCPTAFKMMDSIIRCGVCGRSAQLLKCTRCHTMRYCGTNCQRKDWPRHKVGCKKD